MSANLASTDARPGDTSLLVQMRPALVSYFKRKTGSTADAEDLAQDVLVRALIHVKWKSPNEARGYLFRIAVNRWRDLRRRQQVRGLTVAWDEAIVAETGAENPSERVLIVEQELKQLLRALEELTVRTRTVLIMVKLERMRIANVAGMLDISVSAVNKHLARGLAHLAMRRCRQDSP